jgi:queuine tRNA-ribosyltransferase
MKFSAGTEAAKPRLGKMELDHGTINTPVFMPVGTAASVKAIRHDRLEEMGYRLILGNTYHLYLRPGMEVIDHFAGLHRFSTWRHNILTDSGGYQVFSLSPFRKISEDGVRFRSHIDGSYHSLTPESAVDIQVSLGSDIQMVLDVCTAYGCSKEEAASAVRLTSAWAERAMKRWYEKGRPGAAFGIVQGNFYPDLRLLSADALADLDFPGYALGGLSVGEPVEVFVETLRESAPLLPGDKPRYLMGVGTPDYILEAVANGIDMFDCVYPTRVARNGSVMTANGLLPLKKERFRFDSQPIDDECDCSACRGYSRAYLRHLFRAGELLGPMLATEHNLRFMETFTRRIRDSIADGTFETFRSDFLLHYQKNVTSDDDQ